MRLIAICSAVLAGIGTAQSLQTGSPFSGAVAPDKASAEPMPLSLPAAIRLGLERNLGAVLSTDAEQTARGDSLIALSRLLPRLDLNVNETSQQIDLAAYGFAGFPGVGSIIGPFGLFDARGKVSQQVFNLRSLYGKRAGDQELKAAHLSVQDARDTVAMVVAALYWQAVAGASRIDAARAQVSTAQAVYQQAEDRRDAGLAPKIDVLRAQAELQTERQRLIADQSEFEKQKLRVEEAIGLPSGQTIQLTDMLSFAEMVTLGADEAIESAYQNRMDYQSQVAKVKAAELSHKSIRAARVPSLSFDGDYGTIGNTATSSHGTYSAKINLTIPLYAGGAERGADIQAEAEYQRQKAMLDELRGRIGFEIRAALLDLKSSADQVDVNKSSVDLAQQQEVQARDRFAAGVTDNLEVVQAQQVLATSNESYIASLYAYNLAKVSLARAMGGTERNLTAWGAGGKP
ncbi:MAG: TolC family protein [Bryobacteraceae bacterium]